MISGWWTQTVDQGRDGDPREDQWQAGSVQKILEKICERYAS
jgi:hypothetical protein